MADEGLAAGELVGDKPLLADFEECCFFGDGHSGHQVLRVGIDVNKAKG